MPTGPTIHFRHSELSKKRSKPASLCWPVGDPRWEAPARELAAAINSGERFLSQKLMEVLCKRLGWSSQKIHMVLPAAEARGMLKYVRNPEERFGVWISTGLACLPND